MSISVIIPCYRAAATLRRAVDSALTGAPADLEVLRFQMNAWHCWSKNAS